MARESSLTQIRCDGCGGQTVTTPSQLRNGDKFFCSDCLVQTQCRKCGQVLNLSKDKFAEVDGNPICTTCNNKANKTDAPSSGILSWGNIIIGSIAIGLIWGLLEVYVFDISNYLSQFQGHFVIIASLPFFAIFWLIWSGYKEGE